MRLTSPNPAGRDRPVHHAQSGDIVTCRRADGVADNPEHSGLFSEVLRMAKLQPRHLASKSCPEFCEQEARVTDGTPVHPRCASLGGPRRSRPQHAQVLCGEGGIFIRRVNPTFWLDVPFSGRARGKRTETVGTGLKTVVPIGAGCMSDYAVRTTGKRSQSAAWQHGQKLSSRCGDRRFLLRNSGGDWPIVVAASVAGPASQEVGMAVRQLALDLQILRQTVSGSAEARGLQTGRTTSGPKS